MKSNITTYLRLKPIFPLNPNTTSLNASKINNSYNFSQLESSSLTYNNLNNINITPDLSNEMFEYETNKNKTVLSLHIPDDARKGYVNNAKKTYDFKFNGIFEPNSTQDEVFDNIGGNVISNSIDGYNSTVFCYGQTGSGKTYTMCGSKNWKERGIIPRLLISLFQKIRDIKDYAYDIFISYLEIYNENAYDLLDKAHGEKDLESWKKIIIYEDNYGNIMLKNLSMIKVENEQQALDLLITGNYIRHISSTQMNMASSRSHAIFSCIIEGRDWNSDVMRVSKINLVDLAGSERMRANWQNATTTETKYINLSLSFLEQVIIALNEKDKGNRSHIPYRNSLMTTIWKDSLGGNCKTILIANVSSSLEYWDETMSTMRFALRCAKVQNEISRNEHMDLNIWVTKWTNENNELRRQLQLGGSWLNMRNVSNTTSNKDEGWEIMKRELNDFEKDECKILISDYWNNEDENKQIQAKNANQLYYIIDFLIGYINTKEKNYKEKMTEWLKENKELITIATGEEEKYKKIKEIINANNLGSYFSGIDLNVNNENGNNDNCQQYNEGDIQGKENSLNDGNMVYSRKNIRVNNNGDI